MRFYHKRGQNESWSFLISILVFIMLVTPIIIWVVHSCTTQNEMQKLLETLVDKAENMKDGEKGSTMAQLESGQTLFYAAKKDYTKEFVSSLGEYEANVNIYCSRNGLLQGWDEKRPAECKESACLCVCESGFADACKTFTCKPFKKGFDPHMNFEDCKFGAFIEGSSNPAMEIYYQRMGEERSICAKQPCISEYAEQRKKAFENILNNYTRCRSYQAKDCMCDIINGAIEKDSQIRFSSDGQTTVLGVYSLSDIANWYNRATTSGTIAKYDSATGNSLAISEMEIGDMVDSKSTDYNYKGTAMLYKDRNGDVAFVKNPGKGFEEIRQKMQLCRNLETSSTARIALLDTTLGGGVIFSELEKKLNAIGRIQSTKSFGNMFESRSAMLSQAYIDYDFTNDNSLKDEAYYILINSYTATTDKRKMMDTPYIEIFSAQESDASAKLADAVTAKLNDIKGKYFKEGVEQPKETDQQYLMNFDIINTKGVGNEPMPQTDVIFTACKGQNAELSICKNSDYKDLPAIFIYIVDTAGETAYSAAGKRELIAQKIADGVQAYLSGLEPTQAEQQEKTGLPSDWKQE